MPVQLSDWTMAPSIWFLMPFGLTAWPLSTAETTGRTAMAPVSCSTSTSTSRATAQ
jgi:hypothetical protein